MHVTVTSLLLSTLAGAAYSVQDSGLPQDILNAVKDATVFVKVEHAGRKVLGARFDAGTTTGSGFVVHRDQASCFVVTNSHVLRSRGTQIGQVSLIFRSGTDAEQTTEVVEIFEDLSNDLAILEAKLENGPHPLTLDNRNAVRETMPVYLVGFPYGRALSVSKGNPAITIGTGMVSSLRLEDGHLAAIQIDGELNPGNSGGPVVTANGDVAGVAVAKIRNTQISYAIPIELVRNLLNGMVDGLYFEEISNRNGTMRLRVRAPALDPLGRLTSARLRLIEGDRVTGEPRTVQGRWEVISPDAQSIEMVRRDRFFEAEFSLSGQPEENSDYYFQVEYSAGEQVNYTRPMPRWVSFAREHDGLAAEWLGVDSE